MFDQGVPVPLSLAAKVVLFWFCFGLPSHLGELRAGVALAVDVAHRSIDNACDAARQLRSGKTKPC